MVIIWGSRHYFRRDVLRERGVCEHCGQEAPLETFTARKMGHLYYVPLIPEGHERVIRLCRRCNRYSSLPVSALPAAIDETTAKATTHLDAGEADGALGLVAALMYLGATDAAGEVLDRLEKGGHAKQAWIGRGVVAEKLGDMAQAADHYAAAVREDGRDASLRCMLADALMQADRAGAALEHLRQAASLAPEDPHVRMQLLSCFETLGDLDGQIDTMQELIRRVPQLASDRKFQKRLRKLCRKAGREERPNPYAPV